MDEKTLEALKGSIRKWEKIVAGTGEDNGPDNCPLCKIFFKAGCVGCPVSASSGFGGCTGTPYTDYADLFDDEEYPPTVEQVAEAAQAELDFLRSLLPTP